MQSMDKTISEVHSLLIEFEKSIKRNKPIVGASSTPQVMAIQGGRVQKYKPQGKAKRKGKWKGKGPQNSYPTKPKSINLTRKSVRQKMDSVTTAKRKDIGKGTVLRNRTLLNMVRSMMSLATLPLSFWDYALKSATRILNMVSTMKVDKTPYEIWHGKVPNLSYLKVRGCKAHVKHHTPDKLQQRSVKCIFVRYPKKTMGYYFYYLPENKIVVESEHPIEVESLASIVSQKEDVTPVRRSRLVVLPPNAKVVKSKCIYKKKTDMDGKVHIYKARLLANGCTQTYGVDYEETFSHVADIRAIRILIPIAAYYDYEILANGH
uniref:Uncharacterized protein n=1 Tax=Tanacetum cinerariifolium TaxID=118510 RepID=A0A699IAD4_TANCI|nr:hypothetical protein [Tanacetum cinerariifolium]